MREHFLFGADMYACRPAQTYPAAQISVGRISEDRELTINPDTLKSLPGHLRGIRTRPDVKMIASELSDGPAYFMYDRGFTALFQHLC